MAHHSQKVIAVRERVIRASALSEQMVIRLVAFQRKQPRQGAGGRSPLMLQRLIRLGALVFELLVFSPAFLGDRLLRLCDWDRVAQLRVRLFPSRAQNLVRFAAGVLDDFIRRALDLELPMRGPVALRPLVSEALVGLGALLALRRRRGQGWRRRFRGRHTRLLQTQARWEPQGFRALSGGPPGPHSPVWQFGEARVYFPVIR